MSMTYNVFLNEVDDSKIQEWISELNKFEMSCEIHPEFSFKTQTGFLPFKINIKNQSHDALLGKDYLTGFEFYLDDFNIEDHQENKEQSFFQKLFKKPIEKTPFHSPEIDSKLKDKKYVISFVFGVADTFELRMASLASATLSKLCNGLCCYVDDDLWYSNETIAQDAFKDVVEYEKSLKECEFRLHEFEQWM